jgi:hypothetical protein
MVKSSNHHCRPPRKMNGPRRLIGFFLSPKKHAMVSASQVVHATNDLLHGRVGLLFPRLFDSLPGYGQEQRRTPRRMVFQRPIMMGRYPIDQKTVPNTYVDCRRGYYAERQGDPGQETTDSFCSFRGDDDNDDDLLLPLASVLPPRSQGLSQYGGRSSSLRLLLLVGRRHNAPRTGAATTNGGVVQAGVASRTTLILYSIFLVHLAAGRR